jgi:hypothetical protein
LWTKIQLRKKAIKDFPQPKGVFICLAKSLALLIKTIIHKQNQQKRIYPAECVGLRGF